MKLESVSIQGVLRFHERVTLAFRDLPSGLIAFVGEFGGGKSTMLGAPLTCAYRKVPGRDRGLLDYVTRTDAFIETVFELEGIGLFRNRLSLDGPNKKAEGIIAQIGPDGQQIILNDGKVTSYDEAVLKILPPLKLLLASAYGAQNKEGSFGTSPKKDRQQLFSTLLGHDHYQELSDRAKSAASLIQQSIDTLSARRDVVARDASDEIASVLEQRAQTLQVDAGQIEFRRAQLQRQVSTLETEYTAKQEAASRHAAASARLEAVSKEIGRDTTEHDASVSALARLPQDETRERDTIVSASEVMSRQLTAKVMDTSVLTGELATIDAQEKATITEADKRIAKNRELADKATQIRAAALVVKAATEEASERRRRLQELIQQRDTVRRREKVQRDALTDVEKAERDLERDRAAAARIGNMPFGEECAPCPFLADAATAKARIPGLTERVGSRGTIEAELLKIEIEGTRIDTEYGTVVAEIKEREQSIEQARPLATFEGDLTLAEERIAGHERRKQEAIATAAQQRNAARAREDRRVEDLKSRTSQAEADRDADIKALVLRFETRATELAEQRDRAAERLANLGNEADLLRRTVAETAEASVDAGRLAKELAAARAEWDESTATLATIKSQVEDLQRRRAEWKTKRDELTVIDASLAHLRNEQVEWSTLTKAFGRDGLPVLEIDAAGPTVTAYANDLLRSCGMGRFSIDLVTQEAKASKGKDGSTMKDAFEVKVYDAERVGGENARDLSDLSGGEQAIVDEALKSAIALLVNSRNRQPIRTCWRDETSGAIDAKNRPAYMQMLRRVHELGGFEKTIYITHNEDAALVADAIVHFEGGQLRVELPPYGTQQEPAA